MVEAGFKFYTKIFLRFCCPKSQLYIMPEKK